MLEQAKMEILFLCTGNSCRLIMAEGMMNHYGSSRSQALSADGFPSGEVHAKSICECCIRCCIHSN